MQTSYWPAYPVQSAFRRVYPGLANWDAPGAYFKGLSYDSIQSMIKAYLKGDTEGIMDATDEEIEGVSNRAFFEPWATTNLGITKHRLVHFALGYGKSTKDCWDKISAQVMA